MTRRFFHTGLAAVFLAVAALSCSKALLPAISIDLSRAPFTVAPPVGSNDILSITSAGL